MKRIFPYMKSALVAGIVIFSCACKGTWVMYDPSQKDHLYFYEQAQSEDSTLLVENVSFVFETEDEITVEVPVRLMGMPSDKARNFEMSFLTDTLSSVNFGQETRQVVNAVQGEDFELVEAVVPAQAVSGVIRLKILRTGKMLSNVVSLLMVVKEDALFKPLARNACRLLISDGEPLCPNWWTYPYATGDGQTYFWHQYAGDFTPQKFLKFLELYHDIANTNPSLYQQLEAQYGTYLDKLQYNEDTGEYDSPIPFGFFQTQKPTVWAKYVLIPLYQYAQEQGWPERGKGYTDSSVTAMVGGWRDPVRLYR